MTENPSLEDAQEAVEYIRGVFPSRVVYNDLVENGAGGGEEHRITGDDLAGACWHLELLRNYLNSKEKSWLPNF